MTTDTKETTDNAKHVRKGGPILEGHLSRERGHGPHTPATDPLAGIIANAADNQRKRDEEKKRREREAQEARARFSLD